MNESTQQPAIYCIGLTGGIGAGKSLVAAKLRENGILVLDLDQLGRELTERDPAIQEKLLNLFGPNAVKQEKVDRAWIKQAMFQCPEKKDEWETFLHPRIRNEFEKQAQYAAEGGHSLIVCEAALLIEGGYSERMNELVVVMATEETRVKRTLQRDGIPEALVKQILKNQASDQTRRKHANVIIHNEGLPDEINPQVATLIERWEQLGWLRR